MNENVSFGNQTASSKELSMSRIDISETPACLEENPQIVVQEFRTDQEQKDGENVSEAIRLAREKLLNAVKSVSSSTSYKNSRVATNEGRVPRYDDARRISGRLPPRMIADSFGSIQNDHGGSWKTYHCYGKLAERRRSAESIDPAAGVIFKGQSIVCQTPADAQPPNSGQLIQNGPSEWPSGSSAHAGDTFVSITALSSQWSSSAAAASNRPLLDKDVVTVRIQNGVVEFHSISSQRQAIADAGCLQQQYTTADGNQLDGETVVSVDTTHVESNHDPVTATIFKSLEYSLLTADGQSGYDPTGMNQLAFINSVAGEAETGIQSDTGAVDFSQVIREPGETPSDVIFDALMALISN